MVYGADYQLQAPRIIEYNIAVDRNFGLNQTVTVSYVSTSASNLTQNVSTPAFTSQYDLANQIANIATSKYRAAQVEFHRRFSSRLQIQASYTWSHATDTASNDTSLGGAFATLYGIENGDSNFDIRHLVKVGGSYGIPTAPLPILNTITKDWFVDFNGTYRSGLPFNLLGLSTVTSETTNNCTTLTNSYCSVGVYSEVRPNQNEQSVWLSTSGVPGGRILDITGFSAPTTFSQGDMDRNALHGLSAMQVDVAIRRRIAVRDRLSVSVSAEAFNILNHPAFANPTPYFGGNLSSPNFGVITQSLGSGFGGTSTYGMGSPRTLEFAFRLQF